MKKLHVKACSTRIHDCKQACLTQIKGGKTETTYPKELPLQSRSYFITCSLESFCGITGVTDEHMSRNYFFMIFLSGDLKEGGWIG